jgi:hypothetical protein
MSPYEAKMVGGNQADDVAEAMRRLGLRGGLIQMAERGQIMKLECEMPQCYCPKGRRHFQERSTPMRD